MAKYFNGSESTSHSSMIAEVHGGIRVGVLEVPQCDVSVSFWRPLVARCPEIEWRRESRMDIVQT
jgi:hypothetical protein